MAAAALLAWVLARLEPAAPSVDSSGVYLDTVKRGQMVRQVRGIGVLVPKTIVFIPASDAGRVVRRLVQPGQPVEPGTVLLELSSPHLEQEYLDSAAQLKVAEADLANLRAQLEDQRLNQASLTAVVEGDYLQAKAQYDADRGQLSRACWTASR